MKSLNYEGCCAGHAVFGSVNHSTECKVATIKDVDLAIKRRRIFREAEINLKWLEKETKKYEVKCTDCNKPIGDELYEIDEQDNPYCQDCATARDWEAYDRAESSYRSIQEGNYNV